MITLWVPALAAAPAVIVNELMSSNGSTLADEEGDFPDWFELFNPTDLAANLQGCGLSDDPGRPFKWRLQNTILGPGEFRVIFASGKDRQPTPPNPLVPEAVPGLVTRLSADAINSADPQQVRSSGGRRFLRAWLSSSGGDLNAVQASTGQQPLLEAEAVNGHAAVRFDGINDGLLLPRVPATDNFTLVAVVRPFVGHEVDPESSGGVGGVSGQRWLFGAAHGGDTDGGAGLSVGTNGVSAYEHGSGYMPALAVHSGPVGSPWAVISLTYADQQPSLALQGLVVRQGLPSPRAQVTAPTEIGTGAYGQFNGDIAEVLIYDRALTAVERSGVEAALAATYAIPLPQPRHTSFNLSASGESLVLTAPDGSTMDRVDFGPLPRDISLGRTPDAIGSWLLFPQPTPGASNNTPAARELLSPVTFSVEGGFFTNAVELVLTSPDRDAVIRFTLDGSEPGETSDLYSAPLRLGSRVGTANAISLIPTAGGWQPPSGEIFKGWAVRARAFKPGALPAEATTHTYFVSPLGRARYPVPVVSLNTAAANFFDPDIGIYVPGNTGANFSQRGPQWERPVFVELFETNGLRVIAQEALVSIHGNTSQNFPIKGLDLDAEGGRGRRPFRHRIFPDRPRDSFENVLLRPSGHDHYLAFMRDELMQSLMTDTGAESQAARLCVVFLNGEYWGLHYLKEKQDTEFVAFYADRAKDGVDYLEGYAAARAGDTRQWETLIDLLTTQDPADGEVYERAQELMDMASYADYKAAESFTYRWDIGNHRFWRPRTPEGRFRWMQFDNDVGWGGFWAVQPAWEFNMLEAILNPSGSLNGHNNETTTLLFRRLTRNAEFRSDFINRTADLLNTIYRPANTRDRIDTFAAALQPVMAEHARRWRAPASLSEWQANVTYLRDFAARRPTFVRQHLRQQFSLGNDVVLEAVVDPPGGGSLRVNSVTVTNDATSPWRGDYFRSHPIPLVAEPSPGYRFAGWDGLFGVTTNRVLLRLSGDTQITARFAPADPSVHLRATPSPEGLRLEITGPAHTNAELEQSADLNLWKDLGPVQFDDEGISVTVHPFPVAPSFFRVRSPTQRSSLPAK